jgi:hypothetical protein
MANGLMKKTLSKFMPRIFVKKDIIIINQNYFQFPTNFYYLC